MNELFWIIWGWCFGAATVLIGGALAQWAGRRYRRRKRNNRVLMTLEEYNERSNIKG